jgi:Lon protease-like protein
VPLLPIFPLEVVLLPGAPLPLHIFEPRYKEMIAECRANSSEFGIVRALENGIAEMGCTAEIVSVTKEYPDGKLDLIAQGRRRFEVMELNQERSFLRADVLIIPDEPELSSEQDRARTIELHRQILAVAGAEQEISGADNATLSFYLAGSLPLDLDFKQKLLGTLSERERMQILASYLENVLPTLRRAARAREKAGGNGHVR